MQWHHTGDYNEKTGGYTKEELARMLPKIGERRVERAIGSGSMGDTSETPGMCTVVEVNEENYRYRVRFDKTGISQCFKLPRIGFADGVISI